MRPASKKFPSEKTVTVHIGHRIRLRRTTLGISQHRLGELLGISFQQVQKYERGANRISAGRLYVLADKLKTDVNYFYEGLNYQKSHHDEAQLSTRRNLEAMRGLQQLSLSVRNALVNLIHALAEE